MTYYYYLTIRRRTNIIPINKFLIQILIIYNTYNFFILVFKNLI